MCKNVFALQSIWPPSHVSVATLHFQVFQPRTTMAMYETQIRQAFGRAFGTGRLLLTNADLKGFYWLLHTF
jgi:hypothetical protein